MAENDISSPQNCLGSDEYIEYDDGSSKRKMVRNYEEPLYAGGTHTVDGQVYRKPKTHVLPFGEIVKAQTVSQEYPEIEKAFRLMRAIMQGYGRDLSRAINMHPEDAKKRNNIQTIKYTLDEFFKQANTNDFTHVLALLAASSTDLSPNRQMDCPIHGKQLAEGVRKSFTGCSAFKSADDNAMPKTCPFGEVFGFLWNTRFIRQGNGSFQYQEATGGFFDTCKELVCSQNQQGRVKFFHGVR